MPIPGLDNMDGGLQLPGMSLPGMGRQPSALRKPLSPQESQGFAKELLGKSQGALGYALGSLNKPGRAVRGLLAGKPSELKNLIPFSDTMGITNPEHEVTGRKLMNQWGVTRAGDKDWGSWGLGLAADVATDPLTYTSFGAKHALNAGGRGLMKAGELGGWNRRALLEGFHGTESGLRTAGRSLEDIEHLRNQGQRIASPAAETAYQAAAGRALRPGQSLSGLARVSVPFRPDLGGSIGTGRLSQMAAGGLDSAGNWLKYGNPVGLHVGALFNNNVRRALDSHSAQAWAEHGSPLERDLMMKARTQQYRTQNNLDQLIRTHGNQYEVPILRAARINAEKTSPLAYMASAGADAPLYQHFLDQTRGLGDSVARYGKWQIGRAAREGAPLADLGDTTARYVHRQLYKPEYAAEGRHLENYGIYPVAAKSNIRRNEVWRGHYGGTDRSNDWVSRYAGSPDIAGSTTGIHSDLLADHAAITGAAANPAQEAAYLVKATQLAERISGFNEARYRNAIGTSPFFSHDLAGAVLDRGSQHARTMAGARAASAALASAATPVGGATGGYVPLQRAMRGMGLRTRDTGAEAVGAAPQTLKRLAPKGAPMTGPLTAGPGPHRALTGAVNQFGVAPRDYDAISRSYAGWTAPEEAIAPIAGIDTATNLFRALAYPIWIGSHVRNATTAAFNNMRSGTQWKDYAKQYKLMRGQLPAAEANALRQSQYGSARIFSGENSGLNELSGTLGSASPGTGERRFSGFTPGTNSYGQGRVGPTGNLVGDSAYLLGKEGMGDLLTGTARWLRGKLPGGTPSENPFRMAGVLGARSDTFAPVIAGRKLGGLTEDFFRGAQHNALTRQGYAPSQAAREIDKVHFDYQDLTRGEKSWGRRGFPFYTFMRKNLPLQAETLATQPGIFSTPFKPSQVDRDKQQWTPDYLANGFVSPMGPELNGTQRYLSSLGLPQEEALKEFKLWNGRPDIQGTLMGLAGNLNPLIKGPLESLTGRQFYSGRKLSDLRPSTTAQGIASLLSEDTSTSHPLAQAITQGIANTPLTRFMTTADKLADTKGLNSNGRKPGWATALNLLTGARISDVDMQKQRFLESRNALETSLQQQPHVSQFTDYYTRPDQRGKVTPQEAFQLRMFYGMQQQGREYSERQRRLQKQQGQ